MRKIRIMVFCAGHLFEIERSFIEIDQLSCSGHISDELIFKK